MADDGDNSSTDTKIENQSHGFADNVDEEDEVTSSPTQEISLMLNIDSLSIKDENKKPNTFLEEPQDSNIQVTLGDTLYSTAAKFEDLNLSEDLLKGLYVEMKFEKPSKIQSISLPMILTAPYKDLVAQAHNGSGKTTCFVLGMLSRVDPDMKAPQALCICPTRELAIQNLEVLRKMGKYTGITSYCAIPMCKSTKDQPFAKTAPITDQVVIGTPGTIQKLRSSGKISTREMKILVFDEADEMLSEDSFGDSSLRIKREIERSSAHCQVLLFSATFNQTVKKFVSRVVKDENQMFVKKEELSLDAVKQYKVNCPDELAKIHVIKDKILELGEKLGQIIIFAHTRASASALHTSLRDYGWECTTIHGAIGNDLRDKVVKEFKDGLTKVLITTDLLARGFDQSQVNLVLNYDLPVKFRSPTEPDYETYLHRCGRAGRFGRKGAVFNLLCTDKDHMMMEKIEKHFGNHVPEVSDWQSTDDFDAALKAAGL